VKQDTLMSVGEAQDVTGLRCGEIVKVAQDEHFPLSGGECVDGAQEDIARLSGEELVLWCAPHDGLDGPVVWPPRMVRAQKTRGIDGGAVPRG
jgi:hypothetical protein